ncbi:MAG: hypothetical protein AB8U25_04330 [Rickettsiales endosymbiont of Dermacentor nuttalli]
MKSFNTTVIVSLDKLSDEDIKNMLNIASIKGNPELAKEVIITKT